MNDLIRLSHIPRILIAALLLLGSLFVLIPQTPVMASAETDNYSTGDNASAQCYAGRWFAQTFTASVSYQPDTVYLKLWKLGSPGTVTLSIRAVTSGSQPTTTDLSSGSVAGTAITSDNSGTWYAFSMGTAITLTQGSQYALVLRASAGDSTNYVAWRYHDSAGAYTGGAYQSSTDSGFTWTTNSGHDFIFSVWGVAEGYTRYEYYSSDNSWSANRIQSDNWSAQTFTTGTAAHSVEQVRVKLFREGSPGTVTVGIWETDNASPTEVIYEGTLNGNLITTDNAGEWYYVDMEEGLHPLNGLAVDTIYAIVISAASGNVTNCIFWRENDVGGYASGAPRLSADGGTTWIADTGDRAFEIYGSTTLDIIDVAIFSSYVEPGDWLICIHYLAEVPPAYPGETSWEYLYIGLSDGAGTYYAKVGLMAWGYKPGSIYLSAASVRGLGLTWKGSYEVSIEPMTGRWDTDPDDATHTLAASDWKGNDLYLLDNWVRTVAQDIEDHYAYLNLAMYTESVGGVTFPSGGGVLTITGGEVFLIGIPNLDQIRPHLFIATTHEFTIPDKSYTHAGQNNWITMLGTTLSNDLTTFGAAFNMTGIQFAAGLMFILIIGAATMFARATGDVRVGLVGAMVILPVGWYLGIMSIALLGIIIQFLILFLVWRLFWSTT